MFNNKKVGHPVEMKGLKRGNNVSFYVDMDYLQALDEIRWREKKSMSRIVRDAIEQYIETHKEGNDTFKLDQWNDNSDFKAVPTILAHSEKWYSYLNDCNKDDLTNIAISAKSILKQIEHYRKQ